MYPKVSKEEWDLANSFFTQHKENKNIVKLCRKKNSNIESDNFLNQHNLDEIQHSFIKAGDTIVALQPGKNFLGEGGNAIVKLGQNENNEYCAVKIEAPYDNSHLIFDERGILKDLGNLNGQATRKIDPSRFVIANNDNKKSTQFNGCVLFKNKLVQSKEYTLQKLIPGQDLNIILDESASKDCLLSYSQRLFYAFMACQRLTELHSKNIIHCDIKSKNIKVTDNDLQLIDFGYALRLDYPNEIKHYPNVIVGSPEYMAPEIAELKMDLYGDLELDPTNNPIFIKQFGFYSIQSDIYALGKLIENDLKLYLFSADILDSDFPQSILMMMQSKDPTSRPELSKVKAYLFEKLKKQSDYSTYSSICDEYMENKKRKATM